MISVLPMGSLNQAKCRTRSPCACITSESTKRFMIKFSLEGCTPTINRWTQFWFWSTQYKPYFPWRQTEFIIWSKYGSSHKTRARALHPTQQEVTLVSSTNDGLLFCGSYTEVNDDCKYNLYAHCRKNAISQVKDMFTVRVEWERKTSVPTVRQRADSCLDQLAFFHEPPAKWVCCPK